VVEIAQGIPGCGGARDLARGLLYDAVCSIHDLTNKMRRRLAVRSQVSEHRLHDILNRCRLQTWESLACYKIYAPWSGTFARRTVSCGCAFAGVMPLGMRRRAGDQRHHCGRERRQASDFLNFSTQIVGALTRGLKSQERHS
jgi:hypothetical protein